MLVKGSSLVGMGLGCSEVPSSPSLCFHTPEQRARPVQIDPGAQLLLLPLNSSGLKWVMEVLQKEGITRKPKNPGHGVVQHCKG